MEAKKKLEELFDAMGILALTCDPTTDPTLKNSIEEYLTIIQAEASACPLPNIAQKAEEVKESIASIALENLISAISEFSTWAQTELRNPTQNTSDSSNNLLSHPDISPQLDTELLVEFIEKHLSGLEEFEGSILAGVSSGEALDELQRSAKAYIHNLKGDAGSIGLTGIERVCHHVEDVLLEKGIVALFDQLLEFKEWVDAWIKALSQGKTYSVNADDFKKYFSKTSSEEVNQDTPKNTVEVSKVEEDLSGANLDLLAELLADSGEKEVVTKSDQYQMEGDPEVFVEFTTEAEDHLGIVETTLLDGNGTFGKEAIDTIFRGIHSIKGASSYFKLLEITEIAHITESLLDEVRTGKRSLDQDLVEIVLTFVDLQRTLIGNAKQAITQGGMISRIPESAEFLTRLEEYQKGTPALVKKKKIVETEAPQVQKPKASPAAAAAPRGDSEGQKGEKLDIKNYVKVETERLDQLIDSIGEMSIYSSMLIQNCRTQFADNEHLIKVTHQVEKFGRELQQIGMAMRLIPIRGLFQKMSRLVWDVAKKIDKEVKFSMEGEDTELDRTIIEKLADPLMHMIRNALDHGVEPPDERESAGKPRAGTVELKAYHAGGNIQIQIVDDGRGLNPEKLIKKAIEKGILHEGQKITDNEAYHLIFAPGFSTAAVVTDISGRGVGMDVVRRNIESMRGRVHITSELGKGTVFTIELPLTLAIIDGIELQVGSECFIVPTLSVVEFMKPQAHLITKTLDRGETFSFRGKQLPVYRLGKLFGIEPKKNNSSDALFVVVETNGDYFTIMVDDIVSTHSTVIKSVGEMFGQSKGVAGCAIMPNGDVALILDLRSLLEFARQNYSFTIDSNNGSINPIGLLQ